MPQPTRPAPIKVSTYRFSPAELAAQDELAALVGLSNRTEAVRYAVRQALQAARKKSEKKT